MGEMVGFGGLRSVVVGDLVQDVLLVGVDAGQGLALEQVGVVVLALEMHAVPNYICATRYILRVNPWTAYEETSTPEHKTKIITGTT